MSKTTKLIAAVFAISFLSACTASLKKDDSTSSGYISYPGQFAPAADSCENEGRNGPITREAIDRYLEEGWPDDAKILASVMNGDATESQKAFAKRCLGWD